MKQGVIEEYEDNQLVVAISDLAAVRGALGRFPVGPQERERTAWPRASYAARR